MLHVSEVVIRSMRFVAAADVRRVYVVLQETEVKGERGGRWDLLLNDVWMEMEKETPTGTRLQGS